jgi:maleylacetoacetate isomerase
MKQLEFEYISINLAALVGNTSETLGEDYRQVNPLEQVPTLVITDDESGDVTKLTQSIAILEYLDEVYPDKGERIYPKDPLQRARVRELTEIINSGTQPLQNLAVLRQVTGFRKTPLPPSLEGTEIEDSGVGMAKASILKGLHAFEIKIKGSVENGMFSAGTEGPSAADICLIPQLYNARRFKLPVEELFPCCMKVEALCNQLESFKKAFADVQIDSTIGK